MFANKKPAFKKNYLSDIDQFLQIFNNLPAARSDARIAEENKYKRIFMLRDTPQLLVNSEIEWIDL